MPSGRDVHTSSPYVCPVLDADVLAGMRAPPEASESTKTTGDNDSSGDESIDERREFLGAFPGQPLPNPNEGNYY